MFFFDFFFLKRENEIEILTLASCQEAGLYSRERGHTSSYDRQR